MSNPIHTSSHYIHGQWTHGTGEALIALSPLDNTPLWQGHHATLTNIHDAYTAAEQALPAWMNLPLDARKGHLHAFAKQVERQREALITLITLETGKPRWEAETETQAVIAKVNISIQAYQERNQERITSDNANTTSCLRYKPHGVMAVLGAFNFPAHLSNGHIVPALLAGNTVIYKPSELTPGVAALIMQCWHDSGLPAGVLNLIQGDARVAKQLLNEPIQGVAFTGSYQTGLAIHQQMSTRPDVILALEMGGNNPLIVEHAQQQLGVIYHTILSSFLTAGQRCTCARRLFLPDNTYGDAVLKQLIQTSKALRIGKPDDEIIPFMGPVIRHTHALAHLNKQKALTSLGGEVLLEMKLLNENSGFLSPGIIDMSRVSAPPDEEIFAPFIQIYRYKHFNDALVGANQTRYGLAAGLFSDNPDTYAQFFNTIRAGLVYWNRATTGASSALPFGGIGHSGNHRPSAYFAADYCAYPIASIEQPAIDLPKSLLPGIQLME